MSDLNKERRWMNSRVMGLAAILAVALVARMLYAHHTGQVLSWHDERVYDDLAWNVAQGHGYSVTEADGALRLTMCRPPVQGFALALVYLLFGHNVLAAKLFLAALSALTCVIAYLVAEQASGKVLAGLLAALGVAIYPAYIYCSATFYPVTLLTFLLGLSFLFMLRAKNGRYPAAYSAAAGLSLGLFSLTATYELVAVPLAALWILGRRDQWRRTIVPAAVLMFAAALPVAPWVARNYVLFRQPVISANFGFNLWEGNIQGRIGRYGRFYINPSYHLPKLGAKTEPEIDAAFRAVAITAIKREPGRFARLVLGKFIVFWDSYPKNPKTAGRRPPGMSSQLLELYAWGVYVLALAGLLRLPRLRGFYALTAIYLLPTLLAALLTVCTPRYRYPLDILLISAAACALTLIPRRLRSLKVES